VHLLKVRALFRPTFGRPNKDGLKTYFLSWAKKNQDKEKNGFRTNNL